MNGLDWAFVASCVMAFVMLFGAFVAHGSIRPGENYDPEPWKLWEDGEYEPEEDLSA